VSEEALVPEYSFMKKSTERESQRKKENPDQAYKKQW
jgi:hypothetical protein